MIGRAPRQPWVPEQTRRALAGSLTLRLREEVEHVPPHRAVAAGLAVPAVRVDDGAVDRTLRRFTPAVQISRTFGSARSAHGLQPDGSSWDAVERQTGLSRTLRVRFDPGASVLDAVTALRELDAVEQASPDYLCETPFAAPEAPGGRGARGWQIVGAEAALAEEPGDPAIVLAVIDSGVSLRHPELRGRLRPGADTVDLPEDHLSPTIHLLGDHTRRDRDPQDEQGHGTACAGLLAARGLGVPRGLAGGCRILPMRALAGARSPGRAAPTAIGAIADLDAAVKLAVDLGARVLNLSFGTPASALREDDPVPHVEVVQYALSRGCVLVAASGNAGDDGLYYPAALPGVIAVGAVDDSERPTSFTSYGPHLALCAPGRDLPTLAIDGYRRSTGTSFAAPFVSAAAALLLSRAARSAAAVDPLQIRRILMESAAPFSAPAEGFGGGVLRIPSALSQLADELSVREVA